MFSLPESEEGRTFIIVMAMMVGGTLSRALMSDSAFDPKKLAGEIILAMIGTVIIVYAGWMEGLSDVRIISYGGLCSLGGVRLISWGIGLYRKINTISGD